VARVGIGLTLDRFPAVVGAVEPSAAAGGVARLGRPLRPPLAGDSATGGSGGGLAESGRSREGFRSGRWRRRARGGRSWQWTAVAAC
jgi:hypothetical protein